MSIAQLICDQLNLLLDLDPAAVNGMFSARYDMPESVEERDDILAVIRGGDKDKWVPPSISMRGFLNGILRETEGLGIASHHNEDNKLLGFRVRAEETPDNNYPVDEDGNIIEGGFQEVLGAKELRVEIKGEASVEPIKDIPPPPPKRSPNHVGPEYIK